MTGGTRTPPDWCRRGRRDQKTDKIRRSRLTEREFVSILREQESGQKTADVCKRHGISEATFYKYKADLYKYKQEAMIKSGGMAVSDARKLRVLKDENAKLKKQLAEAMSDNASLKAVLQKKLCRTV